MPGITDSAPIIAGRQQDGKAAWTMKRESVLSVGKSLSQTNIPSKKRVQGVADITFVPLEKIKPLGKQPVYNMEVDDYHNFSVNGGIIVHNCMDSIRYFVRTLRLVKKANEKPYQSVFERRTV